MKSFTLVVHEPSCKGDFYDARIRNGSLLWPVEGEDILTFAFARLNEVPPRAALGAIEDYQRVILPGRAMIFELRRGDR